MTNQKIKYKMKSTDIVLLSTHAITTIVSVFVSTFLISYIYSISNNYIIDIGLFYGFNYLSMFVFYYLVSRVIDKTDRVTFYRISLIVQGIFILCVIFMGKDLAKYVVLAGTIHGFSSAFYWGSYNLMKNELVSHHTIGKYSLIQMFNNKAINFIVPLILGKIIDSESFKLCAIIVLCAVVIQIILSFFIKSKRPENSSFSIKEFINSCKSQDQDKRRLIYSIILIAMLYGLLSFISPLNTIMIMVAFESNFSLGIFTSIFAVFSMIFLLILKRCTKIGKRAYIYYLSAILPAISILAMILNVNKTTIIINTFIYTIASVLYDFSFDVMRNMLLKKLKMYDSIAEYQCAIELFMEAGRVIIFFAMALVGLFAKGASLSTTLVVIKCLFGVAIVSSFAMNIVLARYEKKFIKNIEIED